jgi:hypothetical protein
MGMKFDIFSAVKIRIVIFWSVMSCSLVGAYQHFKEVYHLSLQLRSVSVLKTEPMCSSKRLVTTYKTTEHHNVEDHNRKDVEGVYEQSTVRNIWFWKR